MCLSSTPCQTQFHQGNSSCMGYVVSPQRLGMVARRLFTQQKTVGASLRRKIHLFGPWLKPGDVLQIQIVALDVCLPAVIQA